MKFVKYLFIFTFGLFLTSCAKPNYQLCKIEGVEAPEWLCAPLVVGSYTGIGSAKKSQAGIDYMKELAHNVSEKDIRKQMILQIKHKAELFLNSFNGNNKLWVKQVLEHVVNEAKYINIYDINTVQMWFSPNGNLYTLSTFPETHPNMSIKNTIRYQISLNKVLFFRFDNNSWDKKLNKVFPERY